MVLPTATHSEWKCCHEEHVCMCVRVCLHSEMFMSRSHIFACMCTHIFRLTLKISINVYIHNCSYQIDLNTHTKTQVYPSPVVYHNIFAASIHNSSFFCMCEHCRDISHHLSPSSLFFLSSFLNTTL